MAATLTWLGQSGFLVEAGGARLLVDPYFAEAPERRYPPPPVDVLGARIDRLLITHEHTDHLDADGLPQIAARSPGLEVVVPAPAREQVAALVPDVPIHAVVPGDVVDLAGGASARVVPAIHALHPWDGYGEHGGRFVGYVVEAGGVTLYHAGDTIATDALLDALAGVRADVALLPVNGRSHVREQQDLVGNLGPRDAVALAEHVGASVLVPTHWDLFEGNTERAGATADAADEAGARVHVLTLARERPWTVTAA